MTDERPTALPEAPPLARALGIQHTLPEIQRATARLDFWLAHEPSPAVRTGLALSTSLLMVLGLLLVYASRYPSIRLKPLPFWSR